MQFPVLVEEEPMDPRFAKAQQLFGEILQLRERGCRRVDGSAAQLPETFTDDGLSRDDGAAPRRTSSRP